MGRLTCIRKFIGALAASAVVATAAAQTGKPALELESAFTDLKLTGRTPSIVPVRVTLRNSGPDTTGVLALDGGGYRMNYPVDLPSGSVKRLTAYALCAEYGGRTRFTLQTDQGMAESYFEVPVEESTSKPILLVGDTPGLMVFMRGAPQPNGRNAARGPRDTYARPGELPDRACGYWAVGTVVLGEGAERMTDAEVGALKTWVTAGGSLVMIGGASSPVLSDPRWAEFAPIRNAVPTTIPRSSALAAMGRCPVPDAPMAIMKGTVPAGCTATMSGGSPIVATRPVGLGKVIFFAFNPFEDPLKRWAGLPRLFSSQSSVGAMATAFDLLAGGQTGGYGPISYDPYSDGGPFTVRLPAAATVAWILIAYLVLVAPVNLILMRKLKRSEWAWVTTPAISLAFAAVFFTFAGGLYSAGLSVSTGGTLVLDSRFDQAYFVGSSQLFFPRGGIYDLGFSEAEAVASGGFGDSYYGEHVADLDAVDMGEIKVDRLRVGNLSFVQVDYAQTVRASKWLDAELEFSEPDGSEGITASGTITNRSPYAVSGNLVCGSYSGVLPPMRAGGSLNLQYFKLRRRPAGGDTERGPDGVYRQYRAGSAVNVLGGRSDRVLIDGVIEGFHPGPQIGTPVQTGQAVRILAVLGDVEAPRR